MKFVLLTDAYAVIINIDYNVDIFFSYYTLFCMHTHFAEDVY